MLNPDDEPGVRLFNYNAVEAQNNTPLNRDFSVTLCRTPEFATQKFSSATDKVFWDDNYWNFDIRQTALADRQLIVNELSYTEPSICNYRIDIDDDAKAYFDFDSSTNIITLKDGVSTSAYE